MQPDPYTYRRLADQYEVVPVWVRMALDQETPVTLFRKLVGSGPGYLLESVTGGEDVGRFSIVGARPFRTLQVTSSGATIKSAQGIEQSPADPFAALRSFVPQGVRPEQLHFAGGAVGYIGYDAVDHLFGSTRHSAVPELPVAWLMECSLLAIVDHLQHELTLVSPTRPLATGGADAAYVAARDRLHGALRRLAAAVGGGQPLPLASTGRLQVADPRQLSIVSKPNRTEFETLVASAQQYIAANTVSQLVVSRRLEFPLRVDPFDLYRAYRIVSPSPYMFFLKLDDRTALLGASPELLVRARDGQVLTRPLAGTRRRGETPEQDAALEHELLNDKKELAEHYMLVDLGCSDLSKVSRPGSVRVARSAYVQRYSHVMHIASDVVGELAPGRDGVDALAACFPAGTLCGTPKAEAVRLIAELEQSARGPYGGAVGYLGYSGELDMCIAIRTIVVRDGRGCLQVGAGVVAQSKPANEFEETENKARSALRALALALQIGEEKLLIADERHAAGGGEGL